MRSFTNMKKSKGKDKILDLPRINEKKDKDNIIEKHKKMTGYVEVR